MGRHSRPTRSRGSASAAARLAFDLHPGQPTLLPRGRRGDSDLHDPAGSWTCSDTEAGARCSSTAPSRLPFTIWVLDPLLPALPRGGGGGGPGRRLQPASGSCGGSSCRSQSRASWPWRAFASCSAGTSSSLRCLTDFDDEPKTVGVMSSGCPSTAAPSHADRHGPRPRAPCCHPEQLDTRLQRSIASGR